MLLSFYVVSYLRYEQGLTHLSKMLRKTSS